MGIFHPYIPHEGTRLIGVEAAGEGLDSGRHSASLTRGSPGVLHGNRTYLLQDDNGQITETHSISAGLDYPGVGPEHAYLKDIGRAEYVGITDAEALSAFHRLCRTEGIIPALESSHAVAYAMQLAATMRPDQHLLVNLSGRGDKDIGTVADLSGADFYCRPSCRGQAVKGGIPTVAVRLREGAGPRSEVKEEHRARPDAGDMSGGGQPPRAAAPTALQEPAK
jgi:tryptophan synthase beta chain